MMVNSECTTTAGLSHSGPFDNDENCKLQYSNAYSMRVQAQCFLGLYKKFAPELIETGRMHDGGIIGNRGQIYRTDAEIVYALARLWKPDVIVDFCTGAGDALSYALLATARNNCGLCISADIAKKEHVLNWLRNASLPMDRLLLCDQRNIQSLLPAIASALHNKERIFWILDTNHEYEMGKWQLEHIIKPFSKRSIFAKDDIVSVNNKLESDMGALYAIREYLSQCMDVMSSNAAFGAVSGVPCDQRPYKGAENYATPGAIPFRPCRRNMDIQKKIAKIYPRWDGDANKMIYFWAPGQIDWNQCLSC